MKIEQYEIWIADLNPHRGTEAGRLRPVLIIQTNHLNTSHLSTIICPITTNVQLGSDILRVNIQKGISNLKEDCDIMMDQIRAIDNKRLIRKVGNLPDDLIDKVKENIMVVLNL